MFAQIGLSLIALLGGAVLSVQGGLNAQLARTLGQPLAATGISIAISGLALLAAAVFARSAPPSLDALRSVPPHLLVGGVLGVAYMLNVIGLAPLLGAGGLIVLAVTGQLLAALVLDHFGLLGFREHHVSAGRLIGAALLVGGAALVRWF